MARVLAACTLLVLGLAAASTAGAQDCPLNPATESLTFTGVASGCTPGANFCAGCICALVDSYAPAFRAAGVVVDPAKPAAFPIDKAAAVITGCTTAYAASLQAASVNVTAIAGLANCDFTKASTVPPCLVQKITALSAANTTNTTKANVTASAGAVAAPLRVATVTASPDGPTITLAGQLNTVSELLTAMNKSADLVALLTPQQRQILAGVDPATLDADAELVQYVGALTNPINVSDVIKRFQAASPVALVDSKNTTTVKANTTMKPMAASGATAARVAAGGVGAVLLAVLLL